MKERLPNVTIERIQAMRREGYNRDQIAAALGISTGVVSKYWQNVKPQSSHGQSSSFRSQNNIIENDEDLEKDVFDLAMAGYFAEEIAEIAEIPQEQVQEILGFGYTAAPAPRSPTSSYHKIKKEEQLREDIMKMRTQLNFLKFKNGSQSTNKKSFPALDAEIAKEREKVKKYLLDKLLN